MTTKKTFKEEATEWMAEFGYSLWCHSSDGSWLQFSSNTPGDHRPVIECKLGENGENKVMRIIGGGLRMWMTITTTDISFKHPDTQQYIDVAQHYSRLCENNPPW
jgi:hypothetical protein